MTWVKIDDTLPGNLKVMSVPVAARWTYLASICYASANKTDGKIPRFALPGLSGTSGTAAKLVEAGLWEPLPDGWLIHDYLKHNRSRDRIEQVSEGARKAGLARHGASETSANRSAISQRNALSGSGSVTSDPLPTSELTDHHQQQIERNASESLDEQVAKCCRGWEKATGTTVTAMLGDYFASELGSGFPLDWMHDALVATGDAGAKSPRYLRAIVERWKLEGRDEAPVDTRVSEYVRTKWMNEVIGVIQRRREKEGQANGFYAAEEEAEANGQGFEAFKAAYMLGLQQARSAG